MDVFYVKINAASYDLIPFAVAQITKDGHLFQVNAAMQELIGIPADGAALVDCLIMSSDMEWLLPRLASPEGVNDAFLMMKKASGAQFMAKITITPQDESPHHVLWINQEYHLEKSISSLQFFFQQAPYPLIVCNPDTGRIMQMNEASQEMLGFDTAQERNRLENIDEIINQKTWKLLFDRVKEEKVVNDVRLMVRDPQGNKIPALLSLRLVDLGKGSCILIGVSTGVSRMSSKVNDLKSSLMGQEVFAPFVDALSGAVCICMLDTGRIVNINAQAARIFQYHGDESEKEITLHNLMGQSHAQGLLDKVAQSGSIKAVEHTVFSLQGRAETCFVSANVLRLQDHAYVVLAFDQKIATHKNVSDHFFELAPLPMMVVAKQERANVRAFNRRAQELFTVENTHALQIRLKDILGLRVYRRFIDVVETAGFVDDFEAELETAYGEKIACLLSGQVVEHEGKPSILLGIHDITERKQSEILLEKFFEAAPLPMFLMRQQDQKIVRSNRRTSELFSVPHNEGPQSKTLAHMLGEEAVDPLLQTLKLGGFVDDYELQITTEYGEKIWGLISAQMMALPDEDLVLLGVNDITDRKQTEYELSLSKEKALEATKQKSTFLSTMSHEIRTPMTGMMGMLELLYMSDLTDEQRESLGVIKDSSTALLTIIDDILDFSKIEAGRLELEDISFNVRDVIESAAELMGGRARNKGVELVCAVAPEVPKMISGDPVRLRQVLLNLVGNAIKFTAQGAVVIRVRPLMERHDTVFLRFEVEDTGVGISKEKHKLLFNPFSQTDASTTRKFGGTGLGLSICKALTELMGGQIGAKSEEGIGSTFWFEVGFDLGEPVAGAPCPDFSGKRVLVLQSHAESLFAMVHALTQAQADVIAGPNLESVREKLIEQPALDAVILDHGPDQDGLETAQFFFEYNNVKPEDIILTSSDYSESIMAHAKDAGIQERLFKPVKRRSLMRATARVMGFEVEKRNAILIKERPQMSREQALKHHKLVLFAEDNPTNQMVIGKQLERLGYAFDIAENGVEALEKLAETPYALLLSDCRMPEMGGLELSRAIRKQEAEATGSSPLPIVALTANATSEDEEACYQAGMDGYLVKPLQFKLLGEAMATWLPLDDSVQEDSALEAPSLPPQGHKQQETALAPPVEVSHLAEVLGMDDPDFLKEMLDFFSTTLNDLCNDLAKAIATGVAQDISDTAHAGKGACLNAGAVALGDLFARVEKDVFTMEDTEIEAMKNRIRQETDRVQAFIEAYGG